MNNDKKTLHPVRKSDDEAKPVVAETVKEHQEKPAEKSAARKEADNPADNPVWVQGRDAAMASISEDDAPYDEADPNHKDWLAGYKFAKGE